MELGFRFCKGRIIAITGTNGKSTVATLIGEILKSAGKDAVVVGRSEIVGKPVALLLLERNATVTVCHSGTSKANRLPCGTENPLPSGPRMLSESPESKVVNRTDAGPSTQ